ncbi:DUF4166 domain-containing protein [Massilia sp. erpn]|uniref:DUF4166 domain-containing protein n=1 Tax=Massilia sp. erpn TaxID=2738142 RepID=UPI002103CC0A|nr:DUF4166 domain-containing protein [Massilia sp. erpn]
MQTILGESWRQLPSALQAHYGDGLTVEHGRMDIEYPRFMQPLFSVLHLLGALVNRSGHDLETVVEKRLAGERQHWHRSIRYADGRTLRFDSYWVAAGEHQLIEFVNPLLGLQMAPHVENGRLHYEGVRFVLKLGQLLLPIPEWLALGHTSIVEEALDERRYRMDFRLHHPLLGQIFRYSGTFSTTAQPVSTLGSDPNRTRTGL